MIVSETLPPHNFESKITWPFGEIPIKTGVCSCTNSVTGPTLRILFGKESSFNKIIMKTSQSKPKVIIRKHGSRPLKILESSFSDEISFLYYIPLGVHRTQVKDADPEIE